MGGSRLWNVVCLDSFEVFTSSNISTPINSWSGHKKIHLHILMVIKYFWRVYSNNGNYRIITLILKKYGNLPLYLENYALFSLPLIFTIFLYAYTLSNILYIVEPSGNIISNDHGTFIHIFMHRYYPIIKRYILNRFFGQCYRFIFRCIFFLDRVTSKIFHFLQVGFFLIWYH